MTTPHTADRATFLQMIAQARREMARARTMEARYEALDRAFLTTLSTTGAQINHVHVLRTGPGVRVAVECETEGEARVTREWFERAGIHEFSPVTYDEDLGFTFHATLSKEG